MTTIASAEELRGAPGDVPDWVRRYTQLPDVPQRVRDLSNTLTRNRRTTYDKVVAVEQFLRRYPYTLDVKPAPPDRDAVEYFLFDLKQGYCDYFASAMVVLLRAQGIPARLATGYVAGKFDNTAHKFIVTEEEAHSWPEVYFPTYGWQAFEPSGYRPPIVRPEESVAPAAGEYTDCYDYEYGDCSADAGMDDLAGLLPDSRDSGAFFGVGQTSRGPGWWPALMVLLLVLALVAPLVTSGERRAAAFVLAGSAYALLLVPVATQVYDARYALSALGPLGAASALALDTLRVRRPARARALELSV
jgi:hypothetical protein